MRIIIISEITKEKENRFLVSHSAGQSGWSTIRENFTDVRDVTDFRKPRINVGSRRNARSIPLTREIDPQDRLLRGERNYSLDYTVDRYRPRIRVVPSFPFVLVSSPLLRLSSLLPLSCYVNRNTRSPYEIS